MDENKQVLIPALKTLNSISNRDEVYKRIEEYEKKIVALRSLLIKSNINVTHFDFERDVVYYDFAYRPYGGAQQKWGKTFFSIAKGKLAEIPLDDLVDIIKNDALLLRKEVEA